MMKMWLDFDIVAKYVADSVAECVAVTLQWLLCVFGCHLVVGRCCRM